jgi:hypothetical protein
MARKSQQDYFRMTRPSSFASGMFIFLILVSLIAAALFDRIVSAFQANIFLNGLILSVLLVGIIYCLAQVYRLNPAAKWMENYRMGEEGALGAAADGPPPELLAPMAAMLRDRPGAMALSATALRSILDSIGTRLDESREISRYMIGLLVFLGLLGTFWGLLQTITSVSGAIGALAPSGGEAETIFEDLITGLEGPLAGMAIAFSSSLFGLSGSLILGFLDIRAGQAQNRFYNELEEHLSTRTQVAIIESPGGANVYADQALAELTAAIADLKHTITASGRVGTSGTNAGPLKDTTAELNAAIDRLVGKGATGAPDTIQDIRNDIRVLTKSIVNITDPKKRK